MPRQCAAPNCGAAKSAAIHVRALGLPGHHAFLDARGAAKLANQSEGRTAYLASEAHKTANGHRGAVCVFEAAGAPTACYGPLTPHHLFPRGRAGSLERAERVAPIADACAEHNRWVSQDADGIAFGETHFVTIGGRDWPLLMTDAQAVELERTGREFKPASNPSLSTSKES